MTRRHFLRLAATLSLAGTVDPWQVWAGRPTKAREYHICLNPHAVLESPDFHFPAVLARAGVSCVWLAGFFYGHWPWPRETLTRAQEALRRAGLEPGTVNVPLGHPGDALGARDGNFPLTPPAHWHAGTTRARQADVTRPRFVSRSAPQSGSGVTDFCEWNWDALLALKNRVRPRLDKTPFVENNEPAVLAWYSSALVWNRREERTSFLVRCGKQHWEITLDGLETSLLHDLCL